MRVEFGNSRKLVPPQLWGGSPRTADVYFSVVAATLFELQTFQSIQIQDFYDARRNAVNEALLFQSREGAFRGSGCHSKIVRKIKPVHRQPQACGWFVEELRDPQKIDEARSKPLMGILLTEHHYQRLRLQ